MAFLSETVCTETTSSEKKTGARRMPGSSKLWLINKLDTK